VFLESLESDEEMRLACRGIAAPLLANMADGGRTPIRSKQELIELGYACAIFPSMAALAACAAMRMAMTSLLATGSSQSADIRLFDFEEFCRIIGLEEVWAFEEKWQRDLNKQVPELRPKQN
jgi:2-methylisocitrate lyase-like PEP mutase family enzyme